MRGLVCLEQCIEESGLEQVSPLLIGVWSPQSHPAFGAFFQLMQATFNLLLAMSCC